MEDIIRSIVLIMIGIMIGGGISYNRYVIPMDALGIEKFQKCEINTTNCHSNWYEIVYKEKNK